MLPGLAAKFFADGRELASAEEISAAALHAFRLSAKRFRYTLELFQNCYGPSLEEKLESLAGLQQVLGEMSDCASTRTLIGSGRFDSFAHRAEFFARLDARLTEKAAEFVKLWRSTFDTEAEQRRWTAYLRHPTAQGKKRKAASGPRKGRSKPK